MLRLAARRSVSPRLLRAAGRLLLCLALVLLPVYGAGAAHFETAIGAQHGDAGHAGDPAAPAKGDDAPLCHQLGACAAYIAPIAPDVARDDDAPAAALPCPRQPASAATHPRFRPPIAGASA